MHLKLKTTIFKKWREEVDFKIKKALKIYNKIITSKQNYKKQVLITNWYVKTYRRKMNN